MHTKIYRFRVHHGYTGKHDDHYTPTNQVNSHTTSLTNDKYKLTEKLFHSFLPTKQLSTLSVQKLVRQCNNRTRQFVTSKLVQVAK